MQLYSIHFIIATVISITITVTILKSWRHRFVSFFIIPIAFYCLFYNFNYGIIESIFPIVLSYVGAIYTSFLFLLLISHRKIGLRVIVFHNVYVKIVLLFVLQFICILYTSIIPWAFNTFPLSNIEAVLFTLFAGTNNGAEEFVISSIADKIIYPSIKFFTVFFIVHLVFIFFLNRENRGTEFSLGKIKFSIDSKDFKCCLYQFQKKVFLLQLLYCFILSLILPGIISSTPFRALFQIPVDSELYRNHFVHPDSIKLETPQNSMNLIVIMLESMETNFKHYTPEIVKLQNEHTNFEPGGVSVAGTSWTIAAITGKLCGIPLNMPMGINEHLGKLPTYLPHARCLMDVLKGRGYNQLYIQGTSGDFTQKRTFWTVHGNVEVHDIEFYKRIGKIPESYHVFWGFEDRKLYHFAKEELKTIANNKAPFALYMLTVDTHQPEGFVDSQCFKDYINISGKLPKALRCASRQLSDFLIWASEQPWYKNTVISVMGDHTMPELSEKAGISASDSLYWTNFIINSAITTPVHKRLYSSLDMFPTLLEAMGFKIKDHGVGLGRSLYSDVPTMLELYGRKELDVLLRERSIQYDKFLFQ